MDKDRTEICKIISEMLDNPDKCGIYQTTRAYDKLEKYVEKQRNQAIGWMYAYACTLLDKGIGKPEGMAEDLRNILVPNILKQAEKRLERTNYMTPVGTSECDSKDMLSYARSLTVCKRNNDIPKALKTLKVIHDICERGIKELECGGKKAEDYFYDIF